MHLKSVQIKAGTFPLREVYPFCLSILQNTGRIEFTTPITFFIGENGSGKSTLLEAISRKADIHIWRSRPTVRLQANPFETDLYRHIDLEWENAPVPGSFFASQTHRDFAKYLEEWAKADPGNLKYFGGRSLLTQSHGQSLMTYFRARYRIEGLYLLDEPETALSPKSQLELLEVLAETSSDGTAQFVICTHSPIIMSAPGAVIYNFDAEQITPINYRDTEHFRLYADFFKDK